MPTGRTLSLLGLTSFLFLVSTPAALAADALIVLLVLIDGRRTRPPSASRQAPRISSLGAVTDITVTVTNEFSRALSLRVTDDLDPSLRRLPGPGGQDEWEEGFPVDVPARSVLRCHYNVRPRARGFLPLGAIHIRTRSPWGLAWRRSTVAASDILQVQPGVRDLLRDRGHAIHRRLRTPGPRRNRQWGDGREFESLRDYVEGDDPRTIDWKASAKRHKYVVRNYEAERSQNIILAIDAGRHMRERLPPVRAGETAEAGRFGGGGWREVAPGDAQGGPLDRERMDYALGACMMLASRAQNFGDRIGVVVFDERVRHVSPPRRADPPSLARTLAEVETRLVEPNYPLALATLGRNFRKRSLVILFCDIIDGSVSRALVQSLTRIGRAHLPLAIAIQNPALEATAVRPVGNAADAYHRAAAEEMVQARATTLQVMRQAGILVVDTPPGDTLVRTLDKYVEIKERGLL
ncbi:MAG: DUF58 domain-containing protein [Gemmatimonadetes bacterium]|nr:DUF58 domain-containing protein [Gemmatimonadota bacterium]